MRPTPTAAEIDLVGVAEDADDVARLAIIEREHRHEDEREPDGVDQRPPQEGLRSRGSMPPMLAVQLEVHDPMRRSWEGAAAVNLS